jgi:hypothetical protein
MFQSFTFAAGKWASGTHDEERREGGLLYVKMASIQEEIEEEGRRTPSPPPLPSHKVTDTWSTRRKLGRFDDARRTKDFLEVEAEPGDPGAERAACDLGSADLVLRAAGALPHLQEAGGGIERGNNYTLLQREERAGYGWMDSKSTGTFPPYYLERQDSGLSVISTISELSEELDEFSDEENEEEEDDQGGREDLTSRKEDDQSSAGKDATVVLKAKLGKSPGEEEPVEGSALGLAGKQEIQPVKKCKKRISFREGEDIRVSVYGHR